MVARFAGVSQVKQLGTAPAPDQLGCRVSIPGKTTLLDSHSNANPCVFSPVQKLGLLPKSHCCPNADWTVEPRNVQDAFRQKIVEHAKLKVTTMLEHNSCRGSIMSIGGVGRDIILIALLLLFFFCMYLLTPK